MVSEPMIRILFFAVFGFLALSMFFNRIFPRFGYTFPLRFIGVQIGLSVLTVFLHGTLVWGARDALLFIGLSTSIGLAAEWLGIKTGRVFGRYRYTAKSGPTCFGAVPVFVPLMWCVIAYMGFWTAAWFRPVGLKNPAAILTASLLVTAWDLVADPLLVFEGAWLWEKPGQYDGVPISNFIGWFITAVFIYSGFAWLGGETVSMPSINWICELPAAGYCLLTGVFSLAAFERKLLLPGLLGSATVLVCLAARCLRG